MANNNSLAFVEKPHLRIGFPATTSMQAFGIKVKLGFQNIPSSLFGSNGTTSVRAHSSTMVSKDSSYHTTSTSQEFVREHLSGRGNLTITEDWGSNCTHFNRLKFYIWNGGDPGFTLVCYGGTDELRVGSVIEPSVSRAGIHPGDVLESVASVHIQAVGPQEALALLRKSNIPAVLRFRSPSGTPVSKKERFNVALGNQKLGITFTGDGLATVPVVNRITARKRDNETHASGVRLGDVLVAINGIDTISLGLDRAVALVAKLPRPLALTFQRVVPQNTNVALTRSLFSRLKSKNKPQDQASRFDTTFYDKQSESEASDKDEEDDTQHTCESNSDVCIVWKNGPLGLTLLEDTTSGFPLVNRLTGKGSSPGIDRLQHGYLLTSINGINIDGLEFKMVHHHLATAMKPIVLIFKSSCHANHIDFRDESNRDSYRFAASLQPARKPKPMRFRDTEPKRVNLRARQSILNFCHTRKLDRVDEDGQNDYEVLWSTKTLGIILGIRDSGDDRQKNSNSSGFTKVPFIRSIKSNSVLRFGVSPVGDTLIAVNNIRTDGLDLPDLRLLLQSATKPAVLRFRRQHDTSFTRESPEHSLYSSSTSSSVDDWEEKNVDHNIHKSSSVSSSEVNYSILWNRGVKLGITFSSYVNSSVSNALVIYVKGIERHGYAWKTNLVRRGDYLVRINGKSLSPNQTFQTTIHSLVKMNKPVVLGFKRPLINARKP